MKAAIVENLIVLNAETEEEREVLSRLEAWEVAVVHDREGEAMTLEQQYR